MVGEHTDVIPAEGIALGVQSMYFLDLETEMHFDVRSCIMDAYPESNSPGHRLCVIFMAPIFVLTVSCYV